MVLSSTSPQPLVVKLVTDPSEVTKAQAQQERYRRIVDWFQAPALAIGEQHRGKCIAVAGQNLFVGNTPAEVLDQVKTAHPDKDGVFLR